MSKDEEVLANQIIDNMFIEASKHIQYLDPVSFRIGARQAFEVADKALAAMVEDQAPLTQANA